MTISATRFFSTYGFGTVFSMGAAMALASGVIGCGDSSSNTGGGGSASTSTSGQTTTGTGTGSSTGTGTGGGANTGPIDAPDKTWTYVPFPDSKCMNNTPTGIGINKNAGSKDVIIFLQGGNACFNSTSCAITAHKNGYGPTDFDSEKTGILDTAPLFSRTNAANPLKDYNYVYVPYCTGDLHFGDNDTMVGNQMRTFHGYNNMEQYLTRIVATYPDAQHVIVAGVSAGGFGAALNYDHVSSKFPNVKVTLIDDSGPPFEAPTAPACLQKRFFDTWGYAKTLPAACTGCKPADSAFLKPYVDYITSTYTTQQLALISSTEDKTISSFLGYGDNDCSGIDAALPGPFTGAQYTAGLTDLRDVELAGVPNFHVFYIDGVNNIDATVQDKTQHVWLGDDPAKVISHDTTLLTWLNQILTNDPNLKNVP